MELSAKSAEQQSQMIGSTSEEISSVSDSSLEIVNNSKDYMEQMNTVLGDILQVSSDMKDMVAESAVNEETESQES